MENKVRYTPTASALGSYFGVGFNSPLEQLDFDMGLANQEFDEDAEDRMMLGKLLEDSALNYFEYKLKISITDRNIEVKDGFNGMIRYKIDGKTIFNGEPTVVENKISNSDYKLFTKDLGYIIQCHVYMREENCNQALLCGLYKGKPVYEVIYRNDELMADIEEMILEVYSILNGITGVESFPWHLVEKYSSTPKQDVLEEFDLEDMAYVSEYDELSQQSKGLEQRLTLIKEYFKAKYKDVKYGGADVGYSFSVSTQKRKGFLDEIALTMAHPDLDIDKYRQPESVFPVIRIKRKG